MNDEPKSLSVEEARVLAAHAGLELEPAHLEDVREIYPYLAAMIARVRARRRAEAEPAHIFDTARDAP